MSLYESMKPGAIGIKKYPDEEDLKPYFYQDHCDRYDYLAAAACGAMAGLVDIFLGSSPADSALSGWTDEQVDHAVMKFADYCGWSPRLGKEDSVASAIGFLEKKYPVNYDQAYATGSDAIFDMSTKNHHLKSLGHAPDIVGLFFSIQNQFTETSTFISDGQLITIKSDPIEMQGGDLISKLFCGVANWFGHIMSDVAGSSGASGRGSGLAIPFYELFGLCDFGTFQVGQYRNTLAKVATKVFQEGYDFRFGLTMAIPVVLCDLSIRLIWALRQHFYYHQPLEDCIPNHRHPSLRVMLLIGNGTLCLMDGADAALRSGGNALLFFTRMNLIAWARFGLLAVKEVLIRIGIAYPLQSPSTPTGASIFTSPITSRNLRRSTSKPSKRKPPVTTSSRSSFPKQRQKRTSMPSLQASTRPSAYRCRIKKRPSTISWRILLQDWSSNNVPLRYMRRVLPPSRTLSDL